MNLNTAIQPPTNNAYSGHPIEASTPGNNTKIHHTVLDDHKVKGKEIGRMCEEYFV